jgi:hypothetical protein
MLHIAVMFDKLVILLSSDKKINFVQFVCNNDTPQVLLHLFHAWSAVVYLQFRSSSFVFFPHNDCDVHIATQWVYEVYAGHSLWFNSLLLLKYTLMDEGDLQVDSWMEA